MKKALPAGRRGFTLIELLISATILITIAASITFLFKASINSLKTGREYYIALNSAQELMEETRALPFDRIISTGPVLVSPISNNLIEIKLALPWKEGKKPIELYTMRSKY